MRRFMMTFCGTLVVLGCSFANGQDKAPAQAPEKQAPVQAPGKMTQAPMQAPTQKHAMAPVQKPTQAPTQKHAMDHVQSPVQKGSAPVDAPVLTASRGRLFAGRFR